MKIITLCGSLRFQECMMRTAEKMALLGNCVLTPIYPTSENPERTKEQLEMLKEEHFKKIELSDVILVINVDDYIGYSTNLEIEYAKKLNKEIMTDISLEEALKIINISLNEESLNRILENINIFRDSLIKENKKKKILN